MFGWRVGNCRGGLIGGVVMIIGSSVLADSHSLWTDKISLNGDLRLRHEIMDKEKEETRNRSRLRARVGMKAIINEEMNVEARLASGSDDPTSSNQTLDGGFSTKDLNLDRFYLIWAPSVLAGGELWAGKFPVNFVMIKDLVWDGDLNPEGLAFSRSFGGEGGVTVDTNLGAWWVEERKSDDDTLVYGLQGVGTFVTHKDVSVSFVASYYQWDNLKGFEPVVNASDGFGNTLAGDEDYVYLNDYDVFELGGRLDFALRPVTLYADWIVNTGADTLEDSGYMFGLKVGKAKAPKTMELDYNYRDLEADATVGAYTDSDSFGGGTNGSGHKISAKYQIAKNLSGGVSVFLQTIDSGGDDLDYERIQIDLAAKF